MGIFSRLFSRNKAITAQSEAQGDSPYTHNPEPGATTSPADQAAIHPEDNRRVKHEPKRVLRDDRIPGSGGAWSKSNPWHTRENEGGNQPYRCTDRPVEVQPNLREDYSPLSKISPVEPKFHMYAIKHGISLSHIAEHMGCQAIRLGITVAQLQERELKEAMPKPTSDISDFMVQGKSNAISEAVGGYDAKQLQMGIVVEKEHTDDVVIAEKIAKDHLCEIPDYYTRLAQMEKDTKGNA